jgi:hypothetical protein
MTKQENGCTAVTSQPLLAEGAGAPGMHRGVVLPRGMTPECLDKLAGILNAHASGETEELDAECAARVFEVVQALRQ